MTADPAVGFWTTVRLLLRASRRRNNGRRRRQRELLRGRAAGETLSVFAILGALLYAALAHGAFSFTLNGVFGLATYHHAERDGRLLVGKGFWRDAVAPGTDRDTAIKREAMQRALAFGGDLKTHEAILREQLEHRPGGAGFLVAETDRVPSGLPEPGAARSLGLVAGTFVLALWFLMLAFQGEGLELDVQRQRHPMWEWLFSHPIRPAAAFFAEMLGPLAVNPIFATAPVFWAVALWLVHGQPGIVPGAVIGAAMAVAASCVSKAIEIVAVVRLPPRSRGAVIGILSWLGYSALVLGLFTGLDRSLAGAVLSMVDRVHWTAAAAPAHWIFGLTTGDEPVLGLALVTNLALATAIVAASVWVSARAADAGITGRIGSDRDARRAPGPRTGWRLVRDPLLRKEILWFMRDRSAMVQAVLIPLTMGATQAFQFRSMADTAAGSWNWLCGFGVLCGTYMLAVVGPRSLTSEGGALWIPLTWPRGLEPLLKAKAQLWWIISSIVVFAVLAFTLTRFPGDTAQILLVAIGWFIFGRSLAEKMVTLVVAPSSSGEPEPIPRGRRWAAQLGTFSFGAGVITENWHLAALGVVYSTLTATAMWQNFRERLPCLFDPDSERLPPPPTLMHAMVAISAMVDGMGLVAIVLLALAGFRNWMAMQTAAYGLTALVTWLATTAFLEHRGVPAKRIWNWPAAERSPAPAFVGRLVPLRRPAPRLLLGVGIGAICGALGLAYVSLVSRIPWVAERIAEQTTRFGQDPVGEQWLIIAAVAFAPLAEEYLFRGLLLRALDREWGGWKALLGTTLFFTVYHPPLAWVPVATVGFIVAVLFKATGSLWPGVMVHAVYNAIVSFAT